MSENLEKSPNGWKSKKCLCKVIIETPKGRRNKFDYDPDYHLFALGGLLPEGLAFPFDFGFIPSTLGDDGDPLDVMVLMDEPAHVAVYSMFALLESSKRIRLKTGKRRSTIA